MRWLVHADKCEIFTDVDGVYTADPRIVKNATGGQYGAGE